MDDSSLFENELLKNDCAPCPQCTDGMVYPVFPEHKVHYDYACKCCGYRIHFEANVVVE